jgi:hypothetical protein
MIESKDRSGWFGASDVDKIVGNWNTKTWMDWWLVKIGVARNNIETVAMNAGTHKEHQILEYVSPLIRMDKQILIEDLRLRINLDGNVGKHIYEVKTHSAEKVFKPSKKHIQQVMVQMYGFESREADVVSYGLTEGDYKNYFLPIDSERLKFHTVTYDERWINEVFLPKISHLAKCLKEGRLPY